MTDEQFHLLVKMIGDNHAEIIKEKQIESAVRDMGHCDGSNSDQTRQWIMEIDGWQLEEPGVDFLFDLIEATTEGNLLDEIKQWLHQEKAVDTSSPLDMKGCICHFAKWQIHPFISKGTTWEGLREKIIDHFISPHETTRLQTALGITKQKSGECTPTYIRRFSSEASRAYLSARAASEEQRVVSSFLRGFRDRKFAERLFDTGRITTLTAVIGAAREEVTREQKLYCMLGENHLPNLSHDMLSQS